MLVVAERQILLFGLLTITLSENRQICQRCPVKTGVRFTVDRTGFFWLFRQSVIERNIRSSRLGLWLLSSQGVSPTGMQISVFRPKSNTVDPRFCDYFQYKEQHLVECFFKKLKKKRRIATRFDKLASRFLAFVHLGCIRIILA